jgi:hypothetical protein
MSCGGLRTESVQSRWVGLAEWNSADRVEGLVALPPSFQPLGHLLQVYWTSGLASAKREMASSVSCSLQLARLRLASLCPVCPASQRLCPGRLIDLVVGIVFSLRSSSFAMPPAPPTLKSWKIRRAGHRVSGPTLSPSHPGGAAESLPTAHPRRNQFVAVRILSIRVRWRSRLGRFPYPLNFACPRRSRRSIQSTLRRAT